MIDGGDPNEPATKLALTRLRTLVLISLALAIMGIALMLWSFQVQNQRAREDNITRLAQDCVDRGGDIAVREQWQEIIAIIKASEAKRITQAEASKRFIKSYSDALKTAGPVPDCVINVK